MMSERPQVVCKDCGHVTDYGERVFHNCTGPWDVSPLPWKVEEYQGDGTIRDSEGGMVAPGTGEIYWGMDIDDMRFAVKAVNSYDKNQKLIAEMHEALEAVIRHHVILGGLADCGPSKEAGTTETEKAYYCMMAKTRQAIAEAEGKSDK